MYIYIENDNVYLIAKVIGGTETDEYGIMKSSVSRDNTCTTFLELGSFIRNALPEIIETKTYYELELELTKLNKDLEAQKSLEKIISQLEKYKSIVELITTNIDPDIMTLATLNNPITNTLLKNINSIVIDSQTKRDRYLQSNDSIFSVAHETFKTDGHDGEQKASPLGVALREQFSLISLTNAKYDFRKFESLASTTDQVIDRPIIDRFINKIKKIWLEEGNTEETWNNLFADKITNITQKMLNSGNETFKEEELLDIFRPVPDLYHITKNISQLETECPRDYLATTKIKIKEAWFKSGLSKDVWELHESSIDGILSEIDEAITNRYIEDYDELTIIEKLKDIWPFIFPEKNHFVAACKENYEKLERDTRRSESFLKADKLSVITQFFLGKINIYAHNNYKCHVNIGKVLDGDIMLSQELALRVKRSIENNSSVEDTIFKFIDDFNILNKNKSFFEQVFSKTILTTTDKEKIKENFNFEYQAIKMSDHFDEFFFCPEEKDSPYFACGGAISCEFMHLINIIKNSSFEINFDDFNKFTTLKTKEFRKIDKTQIKSQNLNSKISKISEMIARSDSITGDILNWAIKNDFNLDIIKIILSKGINPFDKTNGEYPIIEALKRGQYQIIEYFLKNFTVDINIEQDGKNLIHYATKNDIILEILINKAPDIIDIKDSQDRTFLHSLVENSSPKQLEQYLSNPKVKNLINAADISGETALHKAVKEKNYSKCEILIRNGAKIESFDNGNDSPLTFAAQDQQIYQNVGLFSPRSAKSIFSLLLENSSEPRKIINHINDNGENILDIVIKNSSDNMIAILIEKGANLDRKDINGNNYLHKYLERPDNNAITVLDKLLSKIDPKEKNNDGMNAYEVALQKITNISDYESFEVINHLFEDIKDNFNKILKYDIDIPKFGMAISLWLFKQEPVPNIEDRLLDQLCQNLTKEEKNIIFSLACYKNNIGLFNKLISNDVDIRNTSFYGTPPIYFTIEFGNIEMFKVLYKKDYRNFSVEERSNMLCHCLESRNIQMANIIMGYGNCYGSRGGDNATPLHLASIYYPYDVFKSILDNTSDINLKNSEMETPLLYLLGSRFQDLTQKVIALVERPDVDLTYINSNGENILHLIAKTEKLSLDKTIIEKIIDKGDIDLSLEDKSGKTPIDYADHNLSDILNNIEHEKSIAIRTNI
jgi:ankyrin repeat protein